MLHLFHPALVHFSIAFLIVGGLCESAGILSARAAIQRFGGVLVLAGTVSLLPTVVTGLLAQNSIDPGPEAMATLALHERTGFVIFGWFLLALFWKAWRRGEESSRERNLYALAMIVGVVLVMFEAFLGGRLVYGFGLGVG